jgi:hypothetical protein
MADVYDRGWLRDKEDWGYLRGLGTDQPVLAMRGTYEEATADPRDVLKVENQGPQGACQGHAISSVCEWCYILQTQDVNLQLSRAMGYYESQRISNIRGDRGSTISAGVKLAVNTGICEEPLWPYPSRYNARRPSDWDAVVENAGKYRIKSTYQLKSYEAIRTFVGSGQGGVSIGISWGSGMSQPVLERFAPGGGGHAIGLFSLSERKDSNDRPYVWMMNSWGPSWGVRGWSEWSPGAIESMMRHRYTVAIGLSDMPGVAPRQFDLEDWKRELRA